MKELYEKIFQPAFMDMTLGWFRDTLLKDCLELESNIHNFKIKYGVELELKVTIPEPVEGRCYGKGIVEKLSNLAN